MRQKKLKAKRTKLRLLKEIKMLPSSGKIDSARSFITKVLPIQKAKIETIINNDIDALEIDDLSSGRDAEIENLK